MSTSIIASRELILEDYDTSKQIVLSSGWKDHTREHIILSQLLLLEKNNRNKQRNMFIDKLQNEHQIV